MSVINLNNKENIASANMLLKLQNEKEREEEKLSLDSFFLCKMSFKVMFVNSKAEIYHKHGIS